MDGADKPQRVRAAVSVHLFLRQESEILLLRQYQTGNEDGNYSVPAGHVELNEEVRRAMDRERKKKLAFRCVTTTSFLLAFYIGCQILSG